MHFGAESSDHLDAQRNNTICTIKLPSTNLPSYNPYFPKFIVVAIIKDEEAGCYDSCNMETHLHEIAPVIEKSHTGEHYQEL